MDLPRSFKSLPFNARMPTANLLLLHSEFLKKLVRPLSPILKPNSLTNLPPLLIPPLRLTQVPLHHSKLPQIDRSNRAPLIALRRPFRRLNRRRKRERFVRPSLRIREKSGGRGWRFVGGEGRRGVLLREGDGEIVHEDDGVAAAGRADAEGLEEERGGEEMVVFGFVEVAECFSSGVVSNAMSVCSRGKNFNLQEFPQFPHPAAIALRLPSPPHPASAAVLSTTP